MYLRSGNRRFRDFAPVALAVLLLGLAMYLTGIGQGPVGAASAAPETAARQTTAAFCDFEDYVQRALTAAYEAKDLTVSTCADAEGHFDDGVTWIELDFSDRRISGVFDPDPGSLDHLTRGARLDLRGTSVSASEIDLRRAISSKDSKLAEVLSGNPSTLSQDSGYSLTLLLDGRESDETGLGNLPSAIGEGEILYLTFQFGNRPSGLAAPVTLGVDCADIDIFTGTCSQYQQGGNEYDGSRGTGDSVERFVVFEITVTNQVDGDNTEHVVHVLASSRDSSDTIYVVPLIIEEDDQIEDDEEEEIEITAIKVGENRRGRLDIEMVDNSGMFESDGFNLDYLFDRGAILEDFDDDLRDRLDLLADTIDVRDNDNPQFDVCARHPQVVEALEEEVGERCSDISLAQLGRITELLIYPNAGDIEDPLEEIFYSDLEGLTGLEFLDLGGNELRDLPSNAFRDVGVASDGITMIDMRFNPGRRYTSVGFVPTDLTSAVRGNLQHLQVVRVDDDPRGEEGFGRSSYTVYESDVLVFDVQVDGGFEEIEFSTSGVTDEPAESEDLPNPATITLDRNIFGGHGSFVMAVQMPFEAGGDSDGDNENFNLVLKISGEDDIVTPVTIRDVSRPRTHTISTSSPVYSPPRRPTTPGGTSPSSRLRFPYPITVQGQPLFEQAPGNLDLQHNVPDLAVLIDGNLVEAGFKNYFLRTGGRERWGYPTSEVLVLENGALTQFYQRGVVDFHNVGLGWVVERRLAWDYVGGGLANSIDQGVEIDLINSAPGELIGVWNLKVSNYSLEGIEIGFADFFNRFEGVAAFGFPKTQARVDRDFIGRLRAPATQAGFIRQYFQAAVMEFHPGDPEPVKLSLLGDTLRNLLVPDFERQRGFAAARPLISGFSYSAPLVS